MKNPRTIVIKGDPLLKEANAAEAITPGHLVRFDDAGDIEKHDTSEGRAAKMFAVERASAGQDIGTDYKEGDLARYGVGRSGDEFYALLADGEDVSKGDALASAGGGNLKASPAEPNDGVIVAYALEDKAATGAAERIRVEAA